MVCGDSKIGSVIPLGFEPRAHSLEGCCSIQLSYGTLNAERKGFEPLEVVSLNGFQDRRNRPLCHLSESKSYYRTCPFGVQKYCQISSYANFLLKFSISSPFGSPFGSPVADSLATLEGWEIGPRLGNRAPTGCFHRPPAARSHAWLRCQVSCQQTSR